MNALRPPVLRALPLAVALLLAGAAARVQGAPSSLSLPRKPGGGFAEIPRLTMGLYAGKPAEVRLVRADAAEPAVYSVAASNGAAGDFSFSTNLLYFAAGQGEASFEATANPSRLETLELSVARADDADDRMRLTLPIVRTPLAAFENNFYVCFLKEIPFGTREVRGPDGTVRTEQV